MHFNLDNPDLKFSDWQKLEKEYFDKKMSKYFSRNYSDYIYRSVKNLRK